MEVEDNYEEPNLCSGTDGKSDTGMRISESTNDHMDVGDNNQDKGIETKSDASSGAHEVVADSTVTGDITTNNISIDTDISNQDLQNLQLDGDCVDDARKECGTNEEVIDSVAPNELITVSKCESEDEDATSDCGSDKIIFKPEADTDSTATEKYDPDIRSSDKLLDNVSTKNIELNGAPAPSMHQDRPLPTLKSLLESSNQQPCQSPIEEISKSTNISNESPIEELNNTSIINNNIKSDVIHTFHKVENPVQAHERSNEPHGAHKLQEAGSDNVAMFNTVNRSEGESSFSVAGPVSGLITYSGPIAFSGSISLRSDSSTTSTRSFAFPILPNEWNSSPVRMAKADRRRLQKHRGWRYGFLCCRF
ncbi:uncharacterized protein [Rutidosis leptorrhynchoides]|uniref:uncharacterized protein n=1 Tax=Rutidosis leptorrhynchoides TaxID=125765 RepID=UPI003A991661